MSDLTRTPHEEEMARFPDDNMQMITQRPRGATTAQLKRDINAGLTGDKNADDLLAAAPLGTDDEAAGRPASPAVVAAVRGQQFSPQAQRMHTRRQGRSVFAVMMPMAVVAAITVIGALLVAMW